MSEARIFDPTRKGFRSSVQPSEIVWYDEDAEVSRMCRTSRRSKAPVVMWIDGACRANGTSMARAAYGVYLGDDSQYNTSDYLPHHARQTSQAAEIYAANQAMEIVSERIGGEICRDGVVIVTDSDYLFRAITSYVYNWLGNGFLNAKGGPVVNGSAFRDLHSAINSWEYDNNAAWIRFWKVPRGENQDADRLAKAVLAW